MTRRVVTRRVVTRRVVTRCAVAALLAGVVVGAGAAQGGTARRAPTPAERAAILRPVLSDAGSPAMGGGRVPASCFAVTVSTVASRFAAARGLAACITVSRYLWVLERKGAAWQTDFLGSGPPCWRKVPAGPRAAVHDLFGNAGC